MSTKQKELRLRHTNASTLYASQYFIGGTLHFHIYLLLYSFHFFYVFSPSCISLMYQMCILEHYIPLAFHKQQQSNF